MTSDELLLQLRDIQAPPEPPWWLLAPAWLWLGAILMLVLVAAWWLKRRRRNEQLSNLARAGLLEIETAFKRDGDARGLAIRASRWLRQVALLAFPDERLQAVSGEPWLEFLDRDLHDRPFTRGCGRVFGAGVYQREVAVDPEQVLALCERWLQSVRPELQRGGEGR